MCLADMYDEGFIDDDDTDGSKENLLDNLTQYRDWKNNR
jgi:hypothetical protein